MKDLGLIFKNKREENSISIEEASHDLNVDKDIIENLEIGNTKIFKDIIFLKQLVNDYAKYLSLDKDRINEQLNDYLFEHTSKISLKDIETEKNKVENNRISSPYTNPIKEKTLEINKAEYKLALIVSLILLFILMLVLVKLFLINNTEKIKGQRYEKKNEFTKQTYNY